MIEEINRSPLLRWLVPLFCTLITGIAFAYSIGLSTANEFTFFFPFLLYPLYQKAFRNPHERKVKIASVCCGTLLMLTVWLKKTAQYYGLEQIILNKNIAIIIGFFLFFTAFTADLYEKLKNMEWTVKIPEPSRKKSILLFFSSLLVIELVWLPYFIFYQYPGDMTVDSNDQLRQVLGDAPLSDHHPVIHTFMIKIFYELGLKLFNGNPEAGAATYSICQSILLAACFAYLIVTLYQFGFRKRVLAIVFLYAFLPYHATYSYTMWKDIWFGGIVLAFCVTLWRFLIWYGLHEYKKIPVFESIMLCILGIGVCLFRSNGLYAYIFFLLFFVFYHIRRKQFKAIGICTASLIIALIIKIPVYHALNVIPPDTIESLSIPAQHIAFAIQEGAELTPEQYELLSQVVDIEQIPNRYTNYLSDPIKNLVRETDHQEYITEHKLEFLKLWISLGIQHPQSYLVAQINQTYGYYYPDIQYVIYTIRDEGDYLAVSKDQNFSEIVRSMILNLRNLYLSVHYVGLFWSIGFMTWMMLFICGMAFIRKSGRFLLIYLPVIGVLLTLMIAAPVHAEFRYAYCMFTSMPLFWCIPFLNESLLKQNQAKKETAE